jgi:hypothetical protein
LHAQRAGRHCRCRRGRNASPQQALCRPPVARTERRGPWPEAQPPRAMQRLGYRQIERMLETAWRASQKRALQRKLKHWSKRIDYATCRRCGLFPSYS